MVEKMKLVRVQGTMPQLNEFIGSCCMDGRFDLEPATRYMSESLGYGALNEENPHTAIRDQIETMAQEANIELHKGQQHSDPVDAEGRSYLSDLLEQIDELCAERKILLDQRKYLNKFERIQTLLGLTDKECSQILSINRANDPSRRYKEV